MGTQTLEIAEQRRARRQRCRFPVRMWSPLVSCGSLFTRDVSASGVGLDLGRGGAEAAAFIRVARWCRDFVIEFRLPTGPVCARARVAWVAQMPDVAGLTWRAGLAFTRMSEGSAYALGQFLAIQSVRRLVQEIGVD
jgi:hypothetical protein